MAALVIISILLTRNLQVEPENISKRQLALETVIGVIQDFFKYIPYLMSVAIYIGVANLIGILGFKPPTKDMNVTAALAIMSIVLIEFAGIHAKGGKKWLKSFAEPTPVVLPINILEIFIRPVSLCMRLFGNVLGSFVVMKLIEAVAPVLVPVPLTCYFDIFDGLIQAYVFVFLTALFIKEAIE